MERKKRIFDNRKKDKFQVDDEYLNGYAKLCGWNATLVYMSLCRHANKDQYCFPSVELMAKQHAVSRASIMRGIKTLEDWNIIQVVKERTKRGVYHNNAYILLDKSEWKPKPIQLAHSDLAENNQDTSQVADSNMADTPPMSLTATLPRSHEQPVQVATSNSKETHIEESHNEGTPIFPRGEKEILQSNLDDLVKPYEGKYSPFMVQMFKNKYDQKVFYRNKEMRLWQKLAIQPNGAFDVGKRLATWNGNDGRWSHERQENRRRAWEGRQGAEQPTRRSREGTTTGFNSLAEIVAKHNFTNSK